MTGLRRPRPGAVVLRRPDPERGLRLHHDPRRHHAVGQRQRFRGQPGPFPTVVEYSGYDPSKPGNTTFAQLYNALGLAYVGVNMRGTGCSGGSFLNFEPVQSLDGYDVIETVAAQPWAKCHKVGMVGISYPGISQLYVARTQPPNLAAITPLSVIDDTYRGTLYPGGILNTGFAVPWAAERAGRRRRRTARAGSRPRVDAGDTTCAANQALRLQNPDPLAADRGQPLLHDTLVDDPINPSRFVAQDQRAGVPRRRLAGRADRRPLPGAARRLHRRRRTSTRR